LIPFDDPNDYKTFSSFSRFTEEDFIKMIGEKFIGLERLELNLETTKAEDAVAELKKSLPGLRGVIKEVSSHYFPTIVEF
jgi:hypothetical protein